LKKECECDNIFCFHHESMSKNLSSWNKTRCGFYEIDPYDRKNVKQENSIQDLDGN
jgi:hypothetical protein